MAAWMKGALALVALGAVVALALWLGSETGADGAGAGSAVVSGNEGSPNGGAGMSLPEGVAGQATALAPLPVESLAVSPDDPEAASQDGRASQALRAETVLSGRVIDPSGRPIEGVRIVFHGGPSAGLIRLGDLPDDESPENPETRTDSNGIFEVTVPVPDAEDEEPGLPRFLRSGAQLAAAHEGFATRITDMPKLEEGATDLGTITMDPGTRVVGRVVDESGRAIAGAKVTGQHVEDQGGRRGPSMSRFFSGRVAAEYNKSVTGADGRFMVTGLPPGRAELTAEADGRQLGFKSDLELLVGSTNDVGDIALPAGELIAGFVVDSEGVPVEGAVITVSSMARIVVRRMEDMPRQQIGHEMRLRAESDRDGYFEMVGLGAGQYTVHVSADGFARSSTENVPTGTRDLSVRLEILGELIVTLQSSSDEAPIRGAQLSASSQSDGPFRMGGDDLEVEESDSKAGEYTVLGAGPSGTELVVAAEGFATQELEGVPVLNGGVERMTVQLVPESVIAGTVVDQDGTGIADARVRINEYVAPAQDDFNGGGFRMRREFSRRIGGPDGADLMQESTRTATDEEGRFELRGVPAGDWEITASAEDFVQSTPRVLTVDVGQSQDDVNIPLDIGGAVVGHVTGADGEPVGDVSVIVRPRQASSGGGRESEIEGRLASMFGGGGGPDAPRPATTEPDGSYEVRSLPPGLYEVELASQRGGMRFGGAMVFMGDGAEGSGNEDNIQLATVLAGEETVIDLVQAPMATLEGRVVAGGEPVEVVAVSLNEKGSFVPFGGLQVETDKYGNYAFENVEPGEYEVSSIVPGAALPEKQAVVLEPGQTSEADLVFGGATLFGKVVDAQSGQGAPDVTIVLSPILDAQPGGQEQAEVAFEVVMVGRGGGGGSGMSMSFGGGSQSKVKTDANGDFEVRFLKPGKYAIETLGGAYVNGEADPIEVKDGESLDDVRIEVDRGASITGMVVNGETGQPLSGAPVSLSSDGSGEMTMTENGRFTFEGLDAGDYTISVLGSGFGGAPIASQALTLEVGEFRELNLTTDG